MGTSCSSRNLFPPCHVQETSAWRTTGVYARRRPRGRTKQLMGGFTSVPRACLLIPFCFSHRACRNHSCSHDRSVFLPNNVIRLNRQKPSAHNKNTRRKKLKKTENTRRIVCTVREREYPAEKPFLVRPLCPRNAARPRRGVEAARPHLRCVTALPVCLPRRVKCASRSDSNTHRIARTDSTFTTGAVSHSQQPSLATQVQ